MSTETDMQSGDVRPVVATASGSKLGLWAFLAVLPIGAVVLANAIYQGDDAENAQVTASQPDIAGGQIFAPPPLVLPPALAQPYEAPLAALAQPSPVRVAQQPSSPPAAVQRTPANYAPPVATQPQPVTVQTVPRPEVVFERRADPQPRAELAAEGSVTRLTASRLANPSMTIPQGTIIPAVLETALDSTRGGAARALVQRDIHSFDGSRVLIQRGSRLYGTYEAGINAGERRALVNWTRLIRPDGVTIALDSPASDPLGRAGIEGDVDTHFWQRFGGALLQSVLDIGVGVATREASGSGVYVALPGATQTVTQSAQQSQQLRPVLRVEHGTSVSVFVAHDLDFSDVEH